MGGVTSRDRVRGESPPVKRVLCGVGRSRSGIPGRNQTRCELSNKPAVSKAGPLSKDLKSILISNVIAILSMAGFAALGLSVAAAAAGV